jgi:Spy/CpxP family protein refolding chaperone
MKKILVASALALIGLAGGAATAQSRISSGQANEMKEDFQQFKSKLNLSDSQSVQVRSIDSVYLKGLSSLKQESGSRLSKFREFKMLSAAKDDQMKKVLTKEQYAQYLEYKSQTREELKKSRKKNH